ATVSCLAAAGTLPARTAKRTENRTGPRRSPSVYCISMMRRGSGLQRHQGDLDAAVARAAVFGLVAGDRAALAGTGNDEAIAHDAARHQVVAHRVGAFHRKRLVVGVGALAVGV